MFEPNNRYTICEDATFEAKYGGDAYSTIILYKKRRFLPNAKKNSVVQEKIVIAGERLDHIAFQYLGDPEQFWRICDANNNFLHPLELTNEPGSVIHIGLSGE